jgi:hypothetical protein
MRTQPRPRNVEPIRARVSPAGTTLGQTGVVGCMAGNRPARGPTKASQLRR